MSGMQPDTKPRPTGDDNANGASRPEAFAAGAPLRRTAKIDRFLDRVDDRIDLALRRLME